MFLINKGYATVFRPKELPSGKAVACSLSTGDKQQDGTYKNSNWEAMFIGKCIDEAKTLQDRDRIKINSGKIENRPPYTDKDGVKRYGDRVVIFDFEKMATGGQLKETKNEYKNTAPDLDINSEDLPF